MKRVWGVLFAIIMVCSIAACGAKPAEGVYNEPETESTAEETTAAETTTEGPTTKETTAEETTEETKKGYQPDRSDYTDANASGAEELLESCYKARFDPESSGHILRDLNGDGQPEMLVFERILSDTNWYVPRQGYVLYYFIVSNDRVQVLDVLVNENIPFLIDGASGASGEALEAHISASDNICITAMGSSGAWSALYLIYQIKNDQFDFVKGMKDPGYTGPDTGIYLSDGEGYDTENGTLYEDDSTENGMVPHGKYKTYEQAVNGELNPLGFTLYNNHESDFSNGYGKYHIQKTDTTKEIFSYIKVEKSE